MQELDKLFKDIADAIRAQTGSSAKIAAKDFPQAIAAIGQSSNDLITFTITTNYGGTHRAGTFTAVNGMTWEEWINSSYNTWSTSQLKDFRSDAHLFVEDNCIYVDDKKRCSLYYYDEDISETIVPNSTDIIDPTVDWYITNL